MFKMNDMRNAIAIMVNIILILGALLYLSFIVYQFCAPGSLLKDIQAYSTWTLGLPAAAFGAFGIVSLLEKVSGEKMSLKISGVEFNGPATQVVFWMACYALFVWSIRTVSPAATQVSPASTISQSTPSTN